MLELTISKEGEIPLILGVAGSIINYKKINGYKFEKNPLDIERIAIYSKDWDKELSTTPKVDYYPIITKPSHNGQYCPGKIVEIKEVINKPNS